MRINDDETHPCREKAAKSDAMRGSAVADGGMISFALQERKKEIGTENGLVEGDEEDGEHHGGEDGLFIM